MHDQFILVPFAIAVVHGCHWGWWFYVLLQMRVTQASFTGQLKRILDQSMLMSLNFKVIETNF
ncbi:MAG: hypothetical protein EB003_08435 [Flavobacteriia bacterium]|nr:hypothetical protein [Flavobacteriia bacterium]